MPANVPTWWTDDRVEATVNREFVYLNLHADEQEMLQQSPSFADGLTDDTYLDWILTKARRFFLTLVDSGVPDQIFGIVDDSYDDGDLPIEEESVPDLHLSYEPNAALNKRFCKAQYRYLLRVLEDGEHIRYAPDETVPVYASGLKATIISLGKDGVDKVRLSASTSRYFVRKKITIDHRPSGISEGLVLAEIASQRKYAHIHLLSAFASYLQQDSIYVLYTPSPAYSLKSFLSDVPKAFDHLSKSRRRQILLGWTHCLASALQWLHSSGKHHGAIRPSNIQVTDDEFRIYLGQFDDPGVLGTHARIDDLESYQYAAPERWKRAVTMQTTAPSRVMGASGGRTARRVKADNVSLDDGRSGHSSWSSEQRRVDTLNPTATSYSFMPTSRGNFSRLQLSETIEASVVSDGISTAVRTHTNTAEEKVSFASQMDGQSSNRSHLPAAMSHTSSGNQRTTKAAVKNSGYASAPEIKTAVVQTWACIQHDLFAADVFSLGAIIMDIVTLICKKSAGSFFRHRSAKNRNAGRGGGLADASFHANIGQVMIWGTQLQKYAADRAKRDDGEVMNALGPILQLVKGCLEREPGDRILSAVLEQTLADYISTLVGTEYLHCVPQPVQKTLNVAGQNQSETRLAAEQSPDSTSQDAVPRISSNLPPSQRDHWSQLRSHGLTTTTISSAGPAPSLSSLSLFNFEHDSRSDPPVADERHFLSDSTDEYADSSIDPQELTHRLLVNTNQGWNNGHRNDSIVDPKLTTETSSGAFTYVNYSASESSDAEDGTKHQGGSFSTPPAHVRSTHPGSMQPPAPPPTKALPAAPNLSKQRSQNKNPYSATNKQPERSDAGVDKDVR